MKARGRVSLPREHEEDRRRALRLEWATIGVVLTIIVVMFLAMGSSQAMRTAWVEDILSLIPPAAVLVASRYHQRAPTRRFPYGFHRSIAIAFLCASVALAGFGVLLLYQSVLKLAAREHPTIGTVVLFGHPVWQGWVMIAALVYSSVPSVILGRMKIPLAKRLHDKALYADADMNRADWMTGVAAIVGVLGIGMGWWWADAAAAALISLDVLHDGGKNVAQGVRDLMDERPTTIGKDEADPIPERVRAALRAMEWVEDADVRLREEGHVLTGEVFIVPRSEVGLLERLEEAGRALHALDWRLYDLSVMPVRRLDEAHTETRSPRENSLSGSL